jgi:small subunit ribosomal protein S20
MGNHKSALKQHRQDERRRVQNRYNRSRMRTALKKLRKALAEGDVATAQSLLAPTLALVDRTAKLGAIHGNTADRTKSRLVRAVNR